MADNPVASLHLLKRALAERNRAASSAAVRTLLTMNAPLGRQWKSLAAVAKQNGEVNDALEAMDRYVGPSRLMPQHIYELAAIRAQLGLLAEASDLIRQLPPNIPSIEANAYIRGTIAANMGDFDQAREQLRRAVAANAGAGQAWLALAMLGHISDDDAVMMERAAPLFQSSLPLEQAAFFYALGKLRDQQKNHDAAFATFDAGAAIMRGLRPYNSQRDRNSAKQSISGWTGRERLAGAPGNAGTSRAIFVTGLPRSGTTLVQQILAGHSGVDGGEELGLFRLLEQDIGGKSRAEFDAYCSSGHRPETLRELYERLLAQRFPGNGLVIDKTLNLSRYAGLIAALLPSAPIIWLRRDPLDCAWSAYRTWFLRGIHWSWSLYDIATHFKIEDRLFVHWGSLLGDRILSVDFAELVNDPDHQIKRILDHCGLSHEPACFVPHKTDRVVTTASVAQVREPINKRGLGRSQSYRKYLEPFSNAYFD